MFPFAFKNGNMLIFIIQIKNKSIRMQRIRNVSLVAYVTKPLLIILA